MTTKSQLCEIAKQNCMCQATLLMCEQDQFLEYMWDVFSFDQVRYTTVEHLAEDIIQLARSRVELTISRLSDLSDASDAL